MTESPLDKLRRIQAQKQTSIPDRDYDDPADQMTANGVVPVGLPDGPNLPVEPSQSSDQDKWVSACQSDPALLYAFLRRLNRDDLLKEYLKPRYIPKAIPVDLGTVECSIWDNEPVTSKAQKGKSRNRAGRYAVKIQACVKGHPKPLTGVQDFVGTADLFSADDFEARFNKLWAKSMDSNSPEEAQFVREQIIPYARNNNFLVGRCFVTVSKRDGGGREFHAYHYFMMPNISFGSRDVDSAFLVAGPSRLIKLPAFAKRDSNGKQLACAMKTTQGGTERKSSVILQSRASDHKGLQATWITGIIEE